MTLEKVRLAEALTVERMLGERVHFHSLVERRAGDDFQIWTEGISARQIATNGACIDTRGLGCFRCEAVFPRPPKLGQIVRVSEHLPDYFAAR